MLFQQEDYETCIKLLTDIIRDNKKATEAYALRGLAYRKAGDLISSTSDFDTVIILTPTDADAYSERGVNYFHLGKLQESLSDMNKALELEPENPYRYSSRAYIKGRMRDFMGALEDYEKAVQLDPEDEVAYNNLGLMQEQAGRNMDAKRSFNRSNQLLKDKYGIEVKEPLFPKDDDEPFEIPKEQPSPKKPDTVGSIMFSLLKDKKARKDFYKFLKKGLGRK